MFSVTLSITSAVAMTISISTAMAVSFASVSITSASAISLTHSVMVSVIVTIFRMAFYNIVLRLVTISDNNLFVSSAPVRCVFYPIHICMQVGPGFVYDHFVTCIQV